MSCSFERGSAHRARAFLWIVPLVAITLVGCGEEPLLSEPESDAGLSAAVEAGIGADDWIVVFRDDVQDPPGLSRRMAAESGATVRHVYEHALRGFAATIPPQAVEALQRNPNVAYVERDGVMTKSAVGSWGLDRIDQVSLPLDGSYTPSGDGSGVDAWIIDTGIDYRRTDEFGTRFDTARDRDFVRNDDDASDCDGHGTHVAGTVGSATYGVAKDVTIIGVRVLGCNGSGSYSGVIAGIDYVAAEAAKTSRPAVANMSLGGGFSLAVNAAVEGAVAAGVVMAVAAGNDYATDACTKSPASAGSAITVASSTSSDARSSFSNVGDCVDIFAPGSAITSTVMRSGTGTWSGTSMATPHVTGAAAILLEANPGMSPAQVWNALYSASTKGAISGVPSNTPNALLYVNPGSSGGGGGGGPTDPPPSAGAPTGLAVSYVTKGPNYRAVLSWSGGAPSVDILRDGSTVASGVSNSGSWQENLGKTKASSYLYQVCNAGSTTECTTEETLAF